ncbi:MAG: TolC family protein [Gemmatimonadetes bacterium]|nr:TolC family protein [Gemmatimonadota bacterium]
MQIDWMVAAVMGAALVAHAPVSGQQAQAVPDPLEQLVARAMDVNPVLRAALSGVEVGRARLRAAGTTPDPMLGIGIMNMPIAEPGYADFMTMNVLSVGQRVPYPGKLGLERRVAEYELAAAEAHVNEVRRAVERDVRIAWYDLVLLDRSLEILTRNQAVLADLNAATESRLALGTGGQEDVLKARVDAVQLADEASALTERRRATLARLNETLDRPSDTPVDAPALPDRITRLAVGAAPDRIRFVSTTPGARAGDSPIRTVEALQDEASRTNPQLRAHEARISAQEARVELLRKDHLPDFDLSLQFSQRPDRTDMVSFMVSVPVPVRKARRQDARVAEAAAELASMQAGHHAMVNELRREVAQLHAELERNRTQLALYVRAILPQASAALQSSTSAFLVSRVDLPAVLENQATLYRLETGYHDALTAFARTLAELERVVGKEVLQ